MSGSAVPKPCFAQIPSRGKKLRQNTFSEVDLSRRKSSPATARSRSTRARTSQGSCCRLSSPTARARRSSVDLPNDRRRGTRQKRTRTAAARPLPDDTYKTDPREIYAENSMAKGKAGRHPLLCVRSALAGLIRRDGVQIRLSVAVQNEVCLSRRIVVDEASGSDRRKRSSAAPFSTAVRSRQIMLLSRSRSSTQHASILDPQLLPVFVIALPILCRFCFFRPSELGSGMPYHAVSEMRILEFLGDNK